MGQIEKGERKRGEAEEEVNHLEVEGKRPDSTTTTPTAGEPSTMTPLHSTPNHPHPHYSETPHHHDNPMKPHRTYCAESERDIERNINYYGNQKKHRRKRHREKSEVAAIPTVTIEEIIIPKEDSTGGRGGGFLEAIQGGDPLLSPRSNSTLAPNPHLLSLSQTPSPMDLPPSPPMAQMDGPPIRRLLYAETESKLNDLTKEMSTLKRNLKRFEDEYETIFGYRPSYADKLGNKDMKKCLVGVARIKREMGALHDCPPGVFPPTPHKSLTSLTTTVTQIPLSTTPPSLMTPAELQEEKNSLQKQLLILERKHGRPTKKEEKEIVRELYERYREVKRWGRKSTSSGGGGGKFLGVVPENGVLELGELGEETTSRVLQIDMDLEIDGVAIEIEDEAWNLMDLPTLTARLTELREEKRALRSTLRRFESDFTMTTGRKPQKEEKYSSSSSMETCYQRYKKIKKTIRLLEVLVNKMKNNDE
ncbi:protein FAM13A isoform X2 [Folsomia candida]|nr:protein FAM13A isoform X2 [Folsomia candida]